MQSSFNITTVQLSEEEAKAFVNFVKHRKLIEMLEACNFFTLENGSVEIHVGENGKVMKIDLHKHLRF